MKAITDLLHPGIMISQIWPNSRETEGETARAVHDVLHREFFTAIQTVEVPYAAERKEIAAIVAQHKLAYTYCVSRVLNENKLNLADLDDGNRRASIEAMKRCLYDASEAGANSLCLVSGPRPADDSLRQQALERLADSLAALCAEAVQYPNLQVVVEPLDYYAHKKHALGSTAEAIALCKQLEEQGATLRLCIDTAHCYLNGEQPENALKLAEPYIHEFHFCNCVVDRDHPLFGDHHIPFGEPGVLGSEQIVAIMKHSLQSGLYRTANKPILACEVFNRDSADPLSLLDSQHRLFQQSWELIHH